MTSTSASTNWRRVKRFVVGDPHATDGQEARDVGEIAGPLVHQCVLKMPEFRRVDLDLDYQEGDRYREHAVADRRPPRDRQPRFASFSLRLAAGALRRLQGFLEALGVLLGERGLDDGAAVLLQRGNGLVRGGLFDDHEQG